MSSTPILRAKGLVKRFSGVTALAGVDVELAGGEVHALVGENGAGKSTLIKILTGAYRRDAGEMELEGRAVDFRSPEEAQAAGVVAVYQEVNLLSFRTVAENIYLGREPRRWGFVDWKRMNADAGALLTRLGLAIDPRATLGDLSIALRQMVAIARGVSLNAKVVFLDEPTSSLTEREVSILYDVIRRLKAEGAAVVYISHRFDELYAVCDRVTVLRDGRLVGTRPLEGLERLDLVCMMLGKQRDELRKGTTAFDKHEAAAGGRAKLLRAEKLSSGRRLKDVTVEVERGEIVGMAGLLEGLERLDLVCMMLGKQRDELRKGTTAFDKHEAAAAGDKAKLLRAQGLASGRRLKDVTVEVERGEIVGMAGLLGSGRTETARAIFGADLVESGTVELEGRPLKLRAPGDAIDAGVALLPEDRKAEGIIPELSVRENLTLAALPMITKFGVVSRAKQREIVDRFMKRLSIKASSPEQKIRELSGGNQQKVLLGRWLCRNPKLLLLDEPTRGIDIGAKGDIQELINELAEQGLGVLMISSELEELVEGCSRVIVMRGGERAAELRGDQISSDAIIHAMADAGEAPDAKGGGEAPKGGGGSDETSAPAGEEG